MIKTALRRIGNDLKRIKIDHGDIYFRSRVSEDELFVFEIQFSKNYSAKSMHFIFRIHFFFLLSLHHRFRFDFQHRLNTNGSMEMIIFI